MNRHQLIDTPDHLFNHSRAMKSFVLFVLFLTPGAVVAQTPAPAAPTSPQRIQVPEAWAMGNLLQVVTPVYPEEARKQGIGGKVVIKLFIDTEGKVTEAVPVQGDPLLAKPSADEVSKWKFRPYIRADKKVEVESTATIEFLAATGEVRAPKPYTGPVRLRVSQGVADKMAISKPNPIYPPEALASHVEGDVLLMGIIGKDGNVRVFRVMSGHPLLTEAAARAVSEWQYKPYLLNGEPVEVETVFKISFHLNARR